MSTPKYKFAPAFLNNFLTPFYDLIVEQGGLGKALQKRALGYLNIKSNEEILDVGCGTGTFVIMAKSTYPKCHIIGADPDKNILKIAKKKIERKNLEIDLVNAWAEKLPFQNSMFDVIVSSLTFHHLPTAIKKQALKEIYRVLKKTGRFLFVDIGNPNNLFWALKFAIDFERLFENGEYMKDNLDGKLPLFIQEAGFETKEVAPRYRGIQFLLCTKRE